MPGTGWVGLRIVRCFNLSAILPMKSNHEKAFRTAYPQAIIESHKTHGGERYYVVRRTAKAQLTSGSGSTRISAWRDAAQHLPTPATFNQPAF